MQISPLDYVAVFKMPCRVFLCHSVDLLEKTFPVSLCYINLQRQPNMG